MEPTSNETESTSFYERIEAETRARRGQRGRRRLLGAALGVVAAVLAAGAWFLVGGEDGAPPEEILDDALAAHVEGRIDDATELYGEVLAEEPTNKFAHYNLGLIAQQDGRLADAERSYRQALETDPAYSPAMFNLAIVLFDSGSVDGAIDLYREVIELEPDHAAAHLNLGYALREAGNIEEGNREIARAIAIDPSLEAQHGQVIAADDASAGDATEAGPEDDPDSP